MDWQLRIALVIAGCALIGYIYFDYSKKKKIQKENEKLKRQFDGITDQVDSAGFDHAGVGTPRVAPIETLSDPTISIEGTSVSDFVNAQKQCSASNIYLNNSSDEIQQTENRLDNISKKVESHDIEDHKDEHIDDSIEVQNNSAQHSEEISTKKDASEAMVLSLILQAPHGQTYKGRDFLPLFLSQGLRHGEMAIFHRRLRSGANPGPVLFSLANGIAPGIFNVKELETFETPAFALFMTLPGPEDSQVAYNAMYKTCTLLQKELGGDILDETKSVYSKQTHNHRLDQIKEFSFRFGL